MTVRIIIVVTIIVIIFIIIIIIIMGYNTLFRELIINQLTGVIFVVIIIIIIIIIIIMVPFWLVNPRPQQSLAWSATRFHPAFFMASHVFHCITSQPMPHKMQRLSKATVRGRWQHPPANGQKNHQNYTTWQQKQKCCSCTCMSTCLVDII